MTGDFARNKAATIVDESLAPRHDAGMRVMKHVSFPMFVAAIFLGVYAMAELGAPKSKDPLAGLSTTASQPAQVRPEPSTAVAFPSLPKDNLLAAEQALKGKWVRFRSRVYAIARDAESRMKVRVNLIVPNEPQRHTSISADCYFPKEARPWVLTLADGDEVDLLGYCDRVELSMLTYVLDLRFVDCSRR